MPSRINQPPSGVQTPTETSNSLTPLGEPMNQTSVLSLAEDPVRWHLQYWLVLSVVGMIRGEDPILLGFRIEIEQYKIHDQGLKNQVVRAWKPYQLVNHENCYRQWGRLALENEEVKPFLRDIDRMLVDKGPKTREFLQQLHSVIVGLLQAGEIDAALRLVEKCLEMIQKLEDEEREEEQARNRQPNSPNSTNAVHSQEEEGHVNGDEEMAG